MTHDPLPTRNRTQPGTAYLGDLEALRDEVQVAVQAISTNSLAALEASLWRQEVLCVGLKHLSHTIDPNAVETSLRTRIEAASTALHHLNRTYASLVQQSRDSATLLQHLCRSYDEASTTTGSRRSSLSCEV